MRKLLLFGSISLLNLFFAFTALHAEPEVVDECSLSHLEKCKDIIHPDYKVFSKKIRLFFGKMGHKYVPYLYKGRLLEQFFSVFETPIVVERKGNFYYLNSFRYHSASEMGIAVFTEKGQMVGGGILYYPCAIPDHKNDCPTRARFAIYVKNIPQKDEVIANMKGWVNGIMQLDSFKRDNIHLEQVNVTTLP